jgi:hypothetical protein
LLADEWALNNLDDLAEDIALTQLAETLSRVLSGGAVGRYVVDLNA